MSWSLVVTVPHRERAVAKMLDAFGCPFHLFQELRQHVWRGHIVERKHPIFPGYIFVLLHGFLWERVRSIVGVLGFVTVGERVATVDNKVVTRLVEASVEDVLPMLVAPPITRFHAGDRVCVVGGTSVLGGQVGIFQRMLVGTQAVVEMEWMGRWVPIAVDERDLDFDTTRRRRRRQRRPSERDSTLNSATA